MKRFLVLLVVVGILYAMSHNIGYSPQNATLQPIPQPTQPRFTHEPRVQALLDELQVDGSQIEIVSSDTTPCNPSAQVTLRACTSSTPQTAKIYLTSNFWQADPFRQRSTIAHEYLHTVYTKGIRPNPTDLYAVYNSNARFRERMDVYKHLSEDYFLDELTAVICTEYSDSALPFTLVEYCTTHLPNRNALPSYFR